MPADFVIDEINRCSLCMGGRNYDYFIGRPETTWDEVVRTETNWKKLARTETKWNELERSGTTSKSYPQPTQNGVIHRPDVNLGCGACTANATPQNPFTVALHPRHHPFLRWYRLKARTFSEVWAFKGRSPFIDPLFFKGGFPHV